MNQLVSIVAEITSLPKEHVKQQKELKEIKGSQRCLLFAYVEADMGIRFLKQEEEGLQTLDDLVVLVSQKLEDKE